MPNALDVQPRRILAIQLRQVGDVLMCTPAIRALRRAYPDARIDFLVEAGPAKVLDGNPHITEIILRHPRRGWVETPRIINLVRSRRYDIVIDFLANPRSAVISLLSGAKITISFADRRRSGFYKRVVSPRGDYSGEQKLSLLRPLGIEGGEPRPVFVVSEHARIEAGKWLAQKKLEKGRFIVMDSTHRRVTRLWKRFGGLADAIYREHGVPSVFLWGPGEEGYVDSVLEGCEVKHIKAPRPSFDMTGAIIESAAALIGTCSAPAHVAAALGTPSLQVIGSSRPADWLLPEPIHRAVMLGLPCQPCGSNKCKTGNIECLEGLGPEAVLDELRDLARQAAPELRDLLGANP